MYQMVSGRIAQGHPSAGSWVTYGLGSVSQNLPAYCVLPQPQGLPEGGAPMWDSGYLPAIYQGTVLRGGEKPIFNLAPPPGMTRDEQETVRGLIRRMPEFGVAAVVCVEHVIAAIADLSDRMVVLDFGRKIADDKTQAVLHDPEVARAYLGEPPRDEPAQGEPA